MWKLWGRQRRCGATRAVASVLKDIGPLRMPATLGADVGTKRVDLDTLATRILDQPPHQRQGDAAAAQAIVDPGVLGNDQRLAGAAVGELAFAIQAFEPRGVTAARGLLMSADRQLGSGHAPLVRREWLCVQSILCGAGLTRPKKLTCLVNAATRSADAQRPQRPLDLANELLHCHRRRLRSATGSLAPLVDPDRRHRSCLRRRPRRGPVFVRPPWPALRAGAGPGALWGPRGAGGGSGRGGGRVVAAAAVLAAPITNGVAVPPLTSSLRVSGSDFAGLLATSTVALGSLQSERASCCAGGQGLQTVCVWPATSRRRMGSGSSTGNLALTRSGKRRIACREAPLQGPLTSPL